MRVVILHNLIPPDAPESEQDTLVQVEAVRSVLVRRGHDVSALACTLDLETCRTQLLAARPAAVFNLVEGLGGSDRLAVLAPALLDALGIPYTGNRTEPLCLSNHKLLTKQQLRAAGLPTPDWESLSHTLPGGEQAEEWHGGERRAGPAARLRAPYIVKTVGEHASFGLEDDLVVMQEDGSSVQDRLADASLRLGRECFAEQFITGREFNLSVLADPARLARGAGVPAAHAPPQVLPPAEIDFSHFPSGKPQVVGYRAKWAAGSFEFHHTPRRFDFPAADAPLLERLRSLAAECWNLLGLRGYVRVDFRVDADDAPWILEINTNPCISPDAGLAAAAERAGISFEQLVERILEDALCGLTHYSSFP